MRFVITIGDVVVLGLFVLGIALMLIGITLSWLKKISEKIQRKSGRNDE